MSKAGLGCADAAHKGALLNYVKWQEESALFARPGSDESQERQMMMMMLQALVAVESCCSKELKKLTAPSGAMQ